MPADEPSRSGSAARSGIDVAAATWFARRDAGLSAGEEPELQQWLAEDRRHAAAFAQLEGAWSTFGKPARAGAADALLAELAARRMRRSRTRRIAVTAAMASVVMIFAIVRWGGENAHPASQATAVLHHPNLRELPDGSKVTLREGAEIGIGFTDTQRRITLRKGEALFEVAKDHARPFVVSANGVDVRAVGTAFSVHAGPDAIDVLVTEGTVSVDGAHGNSAAPGATSAMPASVNGANPSEGITVTAGNRVVVAVAISSAAVQREILPPAEIARRLSWRAPRVEFSGMPLAEAVALLNREAAGRTNARLRIADPALDAMRVSGIFRTDNLDAFVLLLEAGFGVSVDRAGETFVLSKAAAAR